MIERQPEATPASSFLVGLVLGGGIVASAGAAYYLYSQSSGNSSGVPPSVFGKKAHENSSGTSSKSKYIPLSIASLPAITINETSTAYFGPKPDGVDYTCNFKPSI